MKNIFATLTLAAVLAGCATPYAPQEFHFGELASGMIESVREVPLDMHAFQDAIEHKINPETADQLVVRLDNGSAVTLMEKGTQRFAPGQRVRIIAGRVARE